MSFSFIQGLLALLLVASLGWWLGRRGRHYIERRSSAEHPGAYFHGINQRLNESREDLQDGLPVAVTGLEANVLAGNLMRRKGEVEHAISTHQSLLSAPGLSSSILSRVRLELARDYIVAGQLDRAERLLLGLIDDAPERQRSACYHLMELYQDQSEWQKAIDTGLKLLPKKSLLRASSAVDEAVLSALSHYSCELATHAMAKNNFHAVRGYLKQALSYDRKCIRASLLLGEAEYNSGNYDQAVKVLREIRKQDALFIPDSIVILARCYEAQGKSDELYDYLQDCMANYPSTGLLLILADEKLRREGHAEAARYMAEALKGQLSQRGVLKLLDYYLPAAEGQEKNKLDTLQQLMSQLLYRKPVYVCQACGFNDQHNHWLCPGCQQWGKMKPLQD